MAIRFKREKGKHIGLPVRDAMAMDRQEDELCDSIWFENENEISKEQLPLVTALKGYTPMR